MKPETQEWIKIAEGDYRLGMSAVEMGLYPQAIYMLCQALEKVLKGAQIEFAGKVPLKIHRLEIIAQDTGLDFSEQQFIDMIQLSKDYTKVRYPDFIAERYNTKVKAAPIVETTKTLYLWTLEKFKNR
jgi:HEPN domain-containing protein